MLECWSRFLWHSAIYVIDSSRCYPFFFDISVLHPQRCYPRGTGLLIYLITTTSWINLKTKKSTVPIDSMFGIFVDIHIFTYIWLIVLANIMVNIPYIIYMDLSWAALNSEFFEANLWPQWRHEVFDPRTIALKPPRGVGMAGPNRRGSWTRTKILPFWKGLKGEKKQEARSAWLTGGGVVMR